jgi:hypothetical protein
MMQAYAEGFEILEKSEFPYDMAGLCRLWNNGGVIRSWLLELAVNAFEHDDSLQQIVGYVEDTGEGRWTVQAALDENVPAPVITLSLQMRFRSRQEDSFSAKVVAALRHQFGGHAVKLAIEPPSTETEPTPMETGLRRPEGELDRGTIAYAPGETLVSGEEDYDTVAKPSPSVQASPTVRSSQDTMVPGASPDATGEPKPKPVAASADKPHENPEVASKGDGPAKGSAAAKGSTPAKGSGSAKAKGKDK